MLKKALLLTTSTLALSACGTLYTTSHDWRLPGGLANYVIGATLSVGLFTSEASVAVNGRQVLQGQSFFWTDLIDMSGTVDGLPINALCHKSAKTCDVSI